MEQMHSPWRSQYIQGFKSEPKEKQCVFCQALGQEDDSESLVVYRGTRAFVLMNRYPYNSGHLMIIPKRHSADFLSLDEEESLECMRLLQAGHRALTEVVKPHAYNIGMNLGRTAGAGIDDHFHWHIVPRWDGDTNFMGVLADVKVISEDMARQRGELAACFTRLV